MIEELTEAERQYYYMEQCHQWAAEQSRRLGRPLTAAVITFGCQMNSRDSEKLTGILEKIGYEMTDSESADFVIYNTCTVRENANMRVYGRLGHMKQIKKKNPEMLIALCGCMMQEPEVVEKLKKATVMWILFSEPTIFSNLQSSFTGGSMKKKWSLISGRIRTRLWKIAE